MTDLHFVADGPVDLQPEDELSVVEGVRSGDLVYFERVADHHVQLRTLAPGADRPPAAAIYRVTPGRSPGQMQFIPVAGLGGNSAGPHDRFVGALLGGAIGDALGYPVEAAGGNARRAGHGPITDYLPLRDGSRRGVISDDTQLTIHVAACLAANGWLDPADLARRFVGWLAEMRGEGQATVEAVRRLQRGVPWHAAGSDSAGNGAAMRAAPIGLFRAADPLLLRTEAVLSALPTHRAPMAVAGAVAMAAAVGWLLHRQPGTWTVAEFIAAVQQAIGGIEPGPLAERQHPEVRTTLAARLGEIPALLALAPADYFTRYSGAFVLESLPAAFYCFLRTPDDVEASLLAAVNHARDADTVAAMAGTLGGALGGSAALPARLVEGLEPRAALLQLAEQLFAVAGSGTIPAS
ncbi:MAG TPA: ADP-ribosylglycohydrolase family protein [Chloroflexia bacterium]|nr:ADP-ribosylglycohydrolase family protein [Chloroflexia bacterium]